MEIGMRNAGMVREACYGFSGFDFCNLVVAGKIGTESGLCQVRDIIGANLNHPYRVEGSPVREKERRMSWRSWLFGEHKKADKAIALADELTQLMRGRSSQRDPFKPVLAELFFRSHDPYLIADAYEMSQESRIYKGPEALGNQ